MRGAILHTPGDVRYEEPDPAIMEPADAIVRTVATCVCGSDLWPYRGIDKVTQARNIGHEFCRMCRRLAMLLRISNPASSSLVASLLRTTPA